jgi:hypothetical protein
VQTKYITGVPCTVPGVRWCAFGVDLCGGYYSSSSAGVRGCKVKETSVISSYLQNKPLIIQLREKSAL